MKKLLKSIRSKAVWTRIGIIKWKLTFFFFFRIIGAVCEIFCVLKVSFSDKHQFQHRNFNLCFFFFFLQACAKYQMLMLTFIYKNKPRFEWTAWKNTTLLFSLAKRRSPPASFLTQPVIKVRVETWILQDPVAGCIAFRFLTAVLQAYNTASGLCTHSVISFSGYILHNALQSWAKGF